MWEDVDTVTIVKVYIVTTQHRVIDFMRLAIVTFILLLCTCKESITSSEFIIIY